jgi:hypothetical protein
MLFFIFAFSFWGSSPFARLLQFESSNPGWGERRRGRGEKASSRGDIVRKTENPASGAAVGAAVGADWQAVEIRANIRVVRIRIFFI